MIVEAARNEDPEAPSALLRSWIDGRSQPQGPEKDKIARSLRELASAIQDNDLDPECFLRLSLIDLSDRQFARIKSGECGLTLTEAGRNPFALFESYEPGDKLEDPLTGDEIDGPIGLFKIDEALFPDARFMERVPELQDMKAGDPRRIRALIRAYLAGLEGRGHCYASARQVDAWVKNFPLFYRTDGSYDIGNAILEPDEAALSFYSENLYSEVHSGERYYWLREIREAELAVSEQLKALISKPENPDTAFDISGHIDDSLDTLGGKLGERLDSGVFREEREQLFSMLGKKRLCIVTGGPGTGKSHEILWFIRQLKKNKEPFLVLAPTGKAAMRLMHDPDSGEEVFAKTIDKFLKEQEGEGKFSASTIVVDEMSMVDLMKFDALLKAIDFTVPGFKRLILVGDRHQLPPIGFGKPFIDIIEYCEEAAEGNMTELAVNCRQEADGAAMECAALFGPGSKSREIVIDRLIHGGAIGSGLEIRGWKEREDLSSLIGHMINDVHKAAFPDTAVPETAKKLDHVLGLADDGTMMDKAGIDRFQLLSPYRTGFAGTIAVNLKMQESYRSGNEFAARGNDNATKKGDKIVITENVYKRGGLAFANGMTGIVDGDGRIRFADIQDPVGMHEVGKESLELAYDITVHKGQGSGFDYVGSIIPQRRYLLTRELVYTAFSRSRKKLYLMLERSDDPKKDAEFWDELSRRSSVAERRTALFKNPQTEYSYSPATGVIVKSRVEYIIWKKLEEHRRDFGGFDFEYEAPLDIGKSYLIHPDFTIKTRDGRTVYWEHLGKLKDPGYRRSWFLRRDDYKAKGLLDQVLTTDELGGIFDESICRVIDAIVEGNKGISNEYSKCHFSLAKN